MFFDHVPQHNLICAHRGARSIAPENTLLAIKKAKEYGAHCLETDVRLSKDGELILFHDPSLERTTNITRHKILSRRKSYRVENFTQQELSWLDAGSWFLQDDPFHTVANGEMKESDTQTIEGQQIPLLRDVLIFCKKHHFPINLEIKDLDTPVGDFTIVDKVVTLLHDTETMDIALLSSFRHEYLTRVKTLTRRIATAILAEKKHPADLIQYLKSFFAEAYHPEEAICDESLLRQLLQSGFHVNSWTVNSMTRARQLHRLGSGVITDWPQLFLPEPTSS